MQSAVQAIQADPPELCCVCSQVGFVLLVEMRETANAPNPPVLDQKRVQGVGQAYAGHNLHNKVSCRQQSWIMHASSELPDGRDYVS